jgi:hypothetical protein
MSRTTPFLIAACLAVPALGTAETRVLNLQQPAAGIATVSLDAGVGDVEIIGADTETIRVQVELKPKRDFITSSRRARRMIEEIEISARVRGDTLELELRPDPDGDDVTEDWSVEVPRRMAIGLDAGVGDVEIQDIQGEIDIDLGVGDVEVLEAAGDVTVDAGVGSVEIRGSWDAFGRIESSSGVGNATLRSPEGRESGSGFIGHNLSARGQGKSRIHVSVGVGDCTIYLR